MDEVIKFLRALSKIELVGPEKGPQSIFLNEAANGPNLPLVEWTKSQDFKELLALFDAKKHIEGTLRINKLIEKYMEDDDVFAKIDHDETVLGRIVDCLDTIELEDVSSSEKLEHIEDVLSGLMMDIEDNQVRAEFFRKD